MCVWFGVVLVFLVIGDGIWFGGGVCVFVCFLKKKKKEKSKPVVLLWG